MAPQQNFLIYILKESKCYIKNVSRLSITHVKYHLFYPDHLHSFFPLFAPFELEYSSTFYLCPVLQLLFCLIKLLHFSPILFKGFHFTFLPHFSYHRHFILGFLHCNPCISPEFQGYNAKWNSLKNIGPKYKS